MSDITFNKARESLGVYRHEDGYLRCRGKLGIGKTPVNKKKTTLLPNSQQFTDLLIKDMH